MTSQKKINNPTNSGEITLVLPVKTEYFVEKNPFIIWNRETVKSFPEKKEERFNKIYFENRVGFHESFNIMDSSLNNLKKDKLILDSLLKFRLSRTLSLTGKYDLFVDLPLVDPTNRINTIPKEIFMVEFFLCFLYTYQGLEGLLFDNRVPSKLLEKYLLIYLGVKQYFQYNSIDIEDQSLDSLDFYLCQVDYFEYFNSKKSYLAKKESIINEFLSLLKRLGLIEGRIGSYYFITPISRHVSLNYWSDIKRFSFPSLSPKKGMYVNHRDINFLESLSNNDKLNSGSFSPFDLYHNEYLVFCNRNDIGLNYITFSDYLKSTTKENSNLEVMKYQKSILLLYSYMDFVCCRDLYRNKSIYYSYNKDWNFN